MKSLIASSVVPVLLLLPGQLDDLYVFDRVLTDGSVALPASPTDHAIIAVYTTLDDTSEVFDLIPMMEFLLANTTDPNRTVSW